MLLGRPAGSEQINPKQALLYGFKICIYRDQDNNQTNVMSFLSEKDSQSAFDDLTRNGSEDGGYLRCELVVQHIKDGTLLRRTMYIDE